MIYCNKICANIQTYLTLSITSLPVSSLQLDETSIWCVCKSHNSEIQQMLAKTPLQVNRKSHLNHTDQHQLPLCQTAIQTDTDRITGPHTVLERTTHVGGDGMQKAAVIERNRQIQTDRITKNHPRRRWRHAEGCCHEERQTDTDRQNHGGPPTSAVTACSRPLYDTLLLNLDTASAKLMPAGTFWMNLRCWLSTSSSTGTVNGPHTTHQPTTLWLLENTAFWTPGGLVGQVLSGVQRKAICKTKISGQCPQKLKGCAYYWPACIQCRGPVLFCSLASVVVCNTPRRACRRLQPHRPGDDVMPPPV